MSRRLRIEYPGAIYHIMNRGDRREPIFLNTYDHLSFLSTLEDVCVKTDWQVHAYCLMPNHFHLALETPRPNLVAGMKWLLGTYTIRFNLRHQLTGHLFAGRYKSIPVCGQERYLATLGDYIHLNPDRANLLADEEPLKNYKWSSFPSYLDQPAQRPAWLRTDRLLGESGIPKDSAAGRREYERRLEHLRHQESTDLIQQIERNWYLGDETFRKELLAQVDENAGTSHYGPELAQRDEELAKEFLISELKKRGLSARDLEILPKGHADKVELAKLIRSQTTMTIQWIADQLHMGSRTYLTHLLYWDGKQKPKAQVKTKPKNRGRDEKEPGPHAISRLGEERRIERLDSSILLTDPLDPRFD